MPKLYVIGNGFDLFHNLPTGYEHFYRFAEEILDEISGFYNLTISNSGLWRDFENDLGKFNWRSFYSAHNHVDVTAENFKPSMIYCLEDDLANESDEHVASIRSRFEEWIGDIDLSVAKKTMNLCSESKFLSFNYTSTIQQLYGIDLKKILHIHGNAEQFDELIFGHGIKIEREPDFDEDGEPTRTPFSDAEGAAMYPLYALQKPVEDLLKQYEDFFQSLSDTDNVIVIGHSLNSVDLPYFQKVAECAPNAVWTVYYYDHNCIEGFRGKLLKCGICSNKIDLRSYVELVRN